MAKVKRYCPSCRLNYQVDAEEEQPLCPKCGTRLDPTDLGEFEPDSPPYPGQTVAALFKVLGVLLLIAALLLGAYAAVDPRRQTAMLAVWLAGYGLWAFTVWAVIVNLGRIMIASETIAERLTRRRGGAKPPVANPPAAKPPAASP